MLKWIVRKYLENRLKTWDYQVLSLETELGYAPELHDYLVDKYTWHLKEALKNRESIRRVIKLLEV
jgi:hypothetical protein